MRWKPSVPVMAAIVVLMLVLAGLGWRHARPTPAGEETPDVAANIAPIAADGTLAVTPEHIRQMGIGLARAAPADQLPVATIPAVIQPPANARMAVAAIFPGVVLRTHVVEGDAVRQGQPLVTISSREVLALGADMARAKARAAVADAGAARLQTLGAEGIVATARADEARALAAETSADLREKTRVLQMAHADPARGVYTLLAPIAGRVTQIAVHAGDPLDGATAPVTIDAANRYEALGQLPARLVGRVAPGMAVRLATPGGAVVGRVIAVGSTIDPHSRSASLRADIPAGAGVVAGQATDIAITRKAPAGAVSVPAAALTTIDGATVVFVPAAGGFAVRPVTSGGEADGRAVLLSGLAAGESVVASGASALKALAGED